jgi:hypothetical protein
MSCSGDIHRVLMNVLFFRASPVVCVRYRLGSMWMTVPHLIVLCFDITPKLPLISTNEPEDSQQIALEARNE